jgi:glycosyltransferase involved in cell wall biosynthesis
VNVLVNAVAARAGGGLRHLGPFVTGLAAAMPEAGIDVYVHDRFNPPIGDDRVKWIAVDVRKGANAGRLIWDNITVRRIAKRYNVVVSPLNYGPILPGVPHLLFQRNLSYFDRSHYGSASISSRVRYTGYRWLAVFGSNTADRVVVPSEAMADRIRPYIVDRTKLRVVPHGFDAPEAAMLAGGGVIAVAKEWMAADIRLLHVGHPSRHKNLPVLARIFGELNRRIPNKRIALAVTFGAGDTDSEVLKFRDVVQQHHVIEDVHFLGTVQNASLYPLYAKSSVLLFPSTCESFGFPILEAFACGTAVVASDIPALREVSGGLGLHHPPHDYMAAATLVEDVLTQRHCPDGGALIKRAYEFRWSEQCGRVANLIEEMVC